MKISLSTDVMLKRHWIKNLFKNNVQRIITIIDNIIIDFSYGAHSSFRLSLVAACGGCTGFSRLFFWTVPLSSRGVLMAWWPGRWGAKELSSSGRNLSQPEPAWWQEVHRESRLQFALQILSCFASNTKASKMKSVFPVNHLMPQKQLLVPLSEYSSVQCGLRIEPGHSFNQLL